MVRARVFILEERCKGCGNCIQFCPRDVLGMSERVNHIAKQIVFDFLAALLAHMTGSAIAKSDPVEDRGEFF